MSVQPPKPDKTEIEHPFNYGVMADYVRWSGALFTAIKSEAKTEQPNQFQIEHLAELGDFLAERAAGDADRFQRNAELEADYNEAAERQRKLEDRNHAR